MNRQSEIYAKDGIDLDVSTLADWVGQRRAIRQQRSKPLADALETWLRDERKKLSSKAPVAKAIDCSLKRWPAFTRFLDDGRICMSNNAADRAVRGIAVGVHRRAILTPNRD